jgi:hypothetical protein
MTKKWIFINLLLFLIACLIAWQLHVSVREFETENDLAKLQPVQDMKQQLAQETILPPLEKPQSYFPAEFTIISENNVFSDSRGQDEDKADDQATPDSPTLTQKPILVGIQISGDQRMASIIDPEGSSRNQNRRSTTKRVGDVYRGYTITEINPDHIVLESNDRREIIPLHEGSKGPQGGKTQILSTRVVSFGAGAASGGSPITVAATSTRESRTPQTSATARATEAASERQQNATAKISQAQANQPPAAQQQQPGQQSPTTSTDSQEMQIIRTPFGNIVRPPRPSRR